MIEDKRKWLRQYAKPCFTKNRNCLEKLPHIKDIEEFLQGDYSREKVMDYFFIPHNLRTMKEEYHFHLVIPYEVVNVANKGISCVLNEPFFGNLPIPLCSRFFDNASADVGKVIITHALEIVDSCSKSDLERYNYLYVNGYVLK